MLEYLSNDHFNVCVHVYIQYTKYDLFIVNGKPMCHISIFRLIQGNFLFCKLQSLYVFNRIMHATLISSSYSITNIRLYQHDQI